MKKILLPTDFSDNAWNAIEYALNFFRNEKCSFYILHTYTPTFYRLDYMLGGPAFSAIPDTGVARAQAGLEKTLTDIARLYSNPNHRFQGLSAFNTLTDEIREVTKRENIELVVMGTQGATGAKEIFIGTHTVYVIRKSHIPVLAVPNGYSFRNISTILLPTDYELPLKKPEVGYLIYVTRLHKAKLRILNVNNAFELSKVQKQNQERLMACFESIEAVFEQVEGIFTPDNVEDYVVDQHIGLLAMMNRKHSFLERLLVKPNTDSIGYHAKIPFLVIPCKSGPANIDES